MIMRSSHHCPSKNRLRLALWAGLVVCLGAFALGAGPEVKHQPLLRFPDIHGDRVVFVHGEDLWTAPVSGGVAQRLTIDDGEERFPKFSPDGKLIAFTATFDGNPDVYVMNPDGGGITRLTWHPGSDEVVGWHPTRNKILFRSGRHSFNRFDRLFLIAPDGSGLEELPLHEAAQGSFSPDGGQIAYNRVAMEMRTWKRYRGGEAQKIYIYDFKTGQDRLVSGFDGTDRIPMWIGREVYFCSDRDGVLNLHALDPVTGKTRQVTQHRDYDVHRPSSDGRRIVYELGGALWLLDTAGGQARPLPIEVRADAPEARPYLAGVSDLVTGFDVSPSGARMAVVARGDLFTVPKADGPIRNLAPDPGSRVREAAWSPDGRQIAFLSDASGEYEIYLVDAMGSGPPVQLTQHRDGYRHTLRWSPDGRKIAFADQTLRFYVLDVASRKVTPVDRSSQEPMDVSMNLKPICDYAWSPDSAWLAYSKINDDLVSQVYLYSLATGESRCAGDGLFNDFGPVFSRDGRHLLFISNRRFDPTFCDFEWEMVYKKTAGIYALPLRRDGAPLLPPRSDEEKPEEPTAGAGKPGEKGPEAAPAPVAIDFEGLPARVEALPLPRGNYRQLAAGDKGIYYLDADEGDFNRFEFREQGLRKLGHFSLAERTAKVLLEEVSDYRLTADGRQVFYRKETSLGRLEMAGPEAKPKEIKLSDLKMWVDPRAEWRQIFHEAWRMERDFYYEPGMHGLDWPAMKEKYGRLMESASCRQDVQYLIGELIGELNTSHTYVSGGERRRKATPVSIGLLGVDWTVDPASQRYQFKRICRVPDWTQEVWPPLAVPGAQVQDGEYLLRVDGQEVTAARSVYSYFVDLAGKQVRLTVNAKPTLEGAREITVRPLGSERTLRYLDWVEHNRQVVDKASGGKIGYLHLPDTYTASTREFPKYFYAQTRKEGIIVDGRFNGGGLDPDIFLQRLGKRDLSYWTRRYSGDQATPVYSTRAHLVCLTNLYAGSGGDELPYEFQLKKLGPVIGTRTWGGLVGISMTVDLVDGGGVTAPDYRIYDGQGRWVVENVGVRPDIEIDLDPAEMARGYDAQLMKGVEVLLEKIKAEPRPWPKRGSFPIDTTLPK